MFSISLTPDDIDTAVAAGSGGGIDADVGRDLIFNGDLPLVFTRKLLPHGKIRLATDVAAEAQLAAREAHLAGIEPDMLKIEYLGHRLSELCRGNTGRDIDGVLPERKLLFTVQGRYRFAEQEDRKDIRLFQARLAAQRQRRFARPAAGGNVD